MAQEWFECKVRYDKTMETGLLKKVTETYLVDALSFTEAEERFLEEIEPMMSGEYSISDIKRAKIAELFESIDSSDDKWNKAKVAYKSYDEKKGVEKRTNQVMLVQAKDLRVAVKNLDKGMQGTLGDWEIVSITETPIMDILKFHSNEKPSSTVNE